MFSKAIVAYALIKGEELFSNLAAAFAGINIKWNARSYTRAQWIQNAIIVYKDNWLNDPMC